MTAFTLASADIGLSSLWLVILSEAKDLTRWMICLSSPEKLMEQYVGFDEIRVVRKQLKGDLLAAEGAEAEQLKVLDDYAHGIQTALNRDGTPPFEYPGVQAGEALDEGAESLWRLGKKGSVLQSASGWLG